MLLHILQKDLKRKRTMNIILLLFIMLATTFLAASVNNMITITGALDYFMDIAKIPDYVMMTADDTEKAEIETLLRENANVTEYEIRDMYMVTDESIEITYSALKPDNHDYKRGNTILLEAVPENFSRVFDSGNAPLMLDHGEIALPGELAETNELQIGDRLKISCGNNNMEFTIKTIAKDALFGAKFIGPKRIFISEKDYESLLGNENIYHTLLYNINCSDLEAFQREFKKQDFEVLITLDKAMIKMCYFFDLVVAGILVIVGVCLILVSFLILRFTIVFTLQEDYKEIGIMKAIGISDIGIKGIYLLKYFAVALTGAAIGLICSFPFEEMLLAQVMEAFVIPEAGSHALRNMVCAVLIVIVVLLFCYGCTCKIRKFTAIEAIRNGGNGERYNGGGKLRLYKRKGMLPCIYLACNDVTSNLKRYLILAVILCIGTLEILLPLTAVHTLQDENIVRTFNVQPATFYIDTGKMEKYVVQEDDTQLRADLDNIKKMLAENGLESEVWVELWYNASCYGKTTDAQPINTTYTSKQFGREEDDYDVIEGSFPVWDNEIMVTEKTARELDVRIGDTVHLLLPEGEKEFLVTGTFQSMMSMGYGMRVNRETELPYQLLSGMLAIQVNVESDLEQEELRERIEEIFPDYQIKDAKEWIDSMVGVTAQLGALQYFITLLVLVINVLITVLMVKTLIARERGEIAMLKSIGFADRTIRGWQSMRILVVLASAILAGTILSGILGPVTVGALFSVMGATSIRLVTKPLEAYLLYPMLMLAVTGIAAYLCAAEIKKVDLKEINTLE